MKVRLSKGEVFETDGATTAELRALRDLMIVEVQEIRGKIHDERQKAKVNGGQYADPAYYGRLFTAKKKMGQAIEALKVIVGDRRRAENIARSNQVHQEFVSICRERMSKELFQTILEEAYRRAAPIECSLEEQRDDD
jgi:hypothetical protein